MIRITLTAVAVSMLVAAAPVSAQQTSTMSCKDQIAKGEPKMNSLTDAAKKASAMKEMTMAKEMMAKNDEKGCLSHMQAFMGATGSNY
jgi:hypothetical protein